MKKASRKIFRYAQQHTGKFIFEVAVVVVAAVVLTVLGLNSGGSSSTTTTNVTETKTGRQVSPYGNETNVTFTAENTVRSGVWALKSPEMESFGDREEAPANAARWLPNGTRVRVRCARPGTWYELELNGHATRWRFFAELENGTYVAMAGFRETSEDGAQHLERCRVS